MNDLARAPDEEAIFEAVDRFVDAMVDGEPVTVESWLERYPELADALRPELELVYSLHQAAGSVAQDAADGEAATLHAAGEAPSGGGRRFIAPGTKVGDHIVQELLGYGGMGEVYRAHHEHLGKSVALKVLPPFLADDPSAIERFRGEVQQQASMGPHRNVVSATHASEHEGRLYLVMEYVAGQDLSKWIRKHGPCSVADAVDYLKQAARGLSHIHEASLVHRDVKPSNMLLTEDGVLKIVDLGVAQLTVLGGKERAAGSRPIDELVGSIDYMAPEQADDPSAADARSDLYGLGCTLYFLLTGRAPFGDRLMLKKLMAHAVDRAPSVSEVRQDVPHVLSGVIDRLLAKSPSDRYASAEELLHDLEHLDGELPSTRNVPGRMTSERTDVDAGDMSGRLLILTLTLCGLFCFALYFFVISLGEGGGLGPEEAVVGSLRADHPVRPKEGSHYLAYPVIVPAGDTYVFTLRSPDFDPALVVRDAEGFELASGDNAPGLGRVAQVSYTSDEESALEILVTTQRAERVGRFVLTMHEVQEPRLSEGEDTAGELTEEDERYHEDETLMDRYHLPVEAGQTYVITMRSSEFNPAVFVESEDGRRLSVSRRLSDGAVRTVYDGLEDGVVYVVANGLETSDRGAYLLALASDQGGELILETSGMLGEGDSQARDSSFYDAHPLSAEAGTTYVITMESEDFDTFLLLVDGEENRLAANDDAMGTNSRLIFEAQETGPLEVWANSYTEGMTGQYRLQVRAMPSDEEAP